MANLWSDLRGIDRRGWLVIGMVGTGNAILVIGGLEGSAAFSLAVLSVLGIVWVFLVQLTRSLLDDNLALVRDTLKEWHVESDFARELIEDYVQTIEDLKRYDLQSSGIHLERLRAIVIRRHPELESEIEMVQHPLNMPGLII